MISVIILCHNDEPTIGRAIKSVGWCDQVIVIDDDSTDATVKIAKSLGACVASRRLRDDFSAQRNFGLSQAKGEWVLFIDSDEEVPGPLQEEIRQVISLGSDVEGYYVRRNDKLFGVWLKHGETANVWLLRLARQKAGKWVRPVHEVWQVAGKIGKLKEPLHHFPHPKLAEFIDEINYYSTLNARYLVASGESVQWWKIPLYPVVKFFHNYFWRLGFLDGTPGAVVTIMMSFHSFLTRSKAYLLVHKPSKIPV